jgi:class 3 adenylate cyclase/pimeloyl-ACP methyl ester carboxylesterase
MVEFPEPSYVEADGIQLAYFVVGEGPHTVVNPRGLSLTLDDLPATSQFARFMRFSRFVMFDRRGQGLSSRSFGFGTIEDRMDDIRVVMDTTETERAVLFSDHDAVCLALLFAATYPERVSGLVLHSVSAPRTRWAPDYPIGLPDDVLDGYTEWVARNWGTGRVSAAFAPDLPNRRELARIERAIATPAMAAEHFRLANRMDVREILPSVQAPTLIIHGRDEMMPIAWARYLAEHLPDATLVETEGHGLLGAPETLDPLIDEVEQFVTGQHPHTNVDVDRVLATVLFVDIATSTQQLVNVGDRRWTELLSQFRRQVRSEIERHHGREINTRGDDVLATFDGSTRAVRCAQAVVSVAAEMGMEVRAGAHTGEVELQDDDITGIAVHTGARVCDLAGPGEILVTATLRELVAGSGLEFESRGPCELRGVPGAKELFAVAS